MRYIYKKQKLDENETRKFMRQIVSAVDHLHKAGIIHRYMIIIIMQGTKSTQVVSNPWPCDPHFALRLAWWTGIQTQYNWGVYTCRWSQDNVSISGSH